ncbi:MAG: PCP reductase family protein, partial [Gemmatimonadota bacterium]|nr:PCP reductase family protein [Gemmatimonadota bacterium]
MKFLCVDCDDVMAFAERQIPGDGTLAAVFTCGSCGREMAMLTNPMETQLVSSMGVKIGGREVPTQPMELARTSLEDGRDDAFVLSEDIPLASGEGETAVGRVVWTSEATNRLERVPSFVRGMV